MASPQASFDISSPALDQWRPNGDRLSFADVAWTGASTAIVLHAALHFFSVVIPGLERFLVLFGPPERLALGLTSGANPIATWLLLLIVVGVWGCFIGVGLLATMHEATDLVRRWVRRAE